MIPCQRAGCTGHYAPDGYCDECGHKAPTSLVPGQRDSSGARASASGPAPAQASASSQAAPSGTGTGSGQTSSHISGRTSLASASSGRGHIGGNLVSIPPVPLRDPASAVLVDPAVGESQRFCATCGDPVGRGHDGKPGRTEGFCPRDRTRFHFTPSLKPGDLVADRYEILGCVAHGGLGWIYLGRDRNISDAGADRWVVLKGLINTSDKDAMLAAVAERRFLVEVDHPNIVEIYDFATHRDPLSGENVGYIVMEYVGGRSLRDLALEHRSPDGARAPLPLPQVLAYAMAVLPALGYLHERGLLFCDFKPDNVIHTGDEIKLIDLGAVRRADDQESALYGTPGYQAPEIARRGPSVASDIYTVGRALAVLSFDFSGFTKRFADRLPDRASVPLLAAEESYDRLLRRATDVEPAQRFATAAEMADQADGVLREVLSGADGRPRPTVSAIFTPERATFGAEGALNGAEVALALPVPLVDPADPGAAVLATLDTSTPERTIAALHAAPWSLEVGLRRVRAYVEADMTTGAMQALNEVARVAPGDWRLSWYAGVIALGDGDARRAAQEFDLVYSALPGEIAPRLALAAAGEMAGDREAARRRYERVWRVDHGYPSAAFGLARVLAADGDRAGALEVLDQVPATSSQHVPAQVAAVRTAIDHGIGTPGEADLLAAGARLEHLRLDVAVEAALTVETYEAALVWIQRSSSTGSGGLILGRPLTERDVRFGLERAYRLLATLAQEPHERYALVDRANEVRPRTMV